MAEALPRETADMPRDVARVPEYLHQDKDGSWFAEYGQFRLRSTFQAIYRRSDAQLELFGFEGAVRVISFGVERDADDFFHEVPEPERFIIERACRAIHFRNFSLSGGGKHQIFVELRSLTRSQLDDSAYDLQATHQRLARFGLTTDQTVIEIVEADNMEPEVLEDLVHIYRELGFAIAFDNFGASPLDVERLVGLKPDIVKLDDKLLREAVARTDMAKLVTPLIAMSVDLGAEVVVKGIETKDEMAFALSTDADLYQGRQLAPYNTHLTAAVAKIDI